MSIVEAALPVMLRVDGDETAIATAIFYGRMLIGRTISYLLATYRYSLRPFSERGTKTFLRPV